MSIDTKVQQAIEQAVEEAGQSEALTRRIAAWLDALLSGNEDLTDQAAADRHLEVLYSEVHVGSGSDENEGDED